MTWLINLAIFLLIGLAAGYLAGLFMKGKSFGLLGNLIIGVIGALVGGFLLGLLGFSAGGLIAQLVTAVLGAVVLLYTLGFLRSKGIL